MGQQQKKDGQSATNAVEIKEGIRSKYRTIALSGNSDCCCMPGECGSPAQAAAAIGYDPKELEAIPQASVLGVGCGAPVGFAGLKKGEVVVDLGSGAGIDVFLSARKVGAEGKAIGIDMTDEMIARARQSASEGGYANVEFRKGDIEKRIPVDDGAADAVISNCVINLTTDKVGAFREVHRILKKGGRMVISDLVTDAEVERQAVDTDKWCACIDGALTRENYIASIRKAGFADVSVLEERAYMEDGLDGRKITSLVIKAVK